MNKYSVILLISTCFIFGGVVIDKRTNLMWQDKKIKQMNNREARLYCKKLMLNGDDDWRLPNIDELKSIVDYNFRNPAIIQIFRDIPLGYYWSSSKGSGSSFWIVDFIEGADTWHDKRKDYYVRCVRQ